MSEEGLPGCSETKWENAFKKDVLSLSEYKFSIAQSQSEIKKKQKQKALFFFSLQSQPSFRLYFTSRDVVPHSSYIADIREAANQEAAVIWLGVKWFSTGVECAVKSTDHSGENVSEGAAVQRGLLLGGGAITQAKQS